MNEGYTKPESGAERLQHFRDTIRGLKRVEEETLARGEHGTAHFHYVNPDKLTEEDAEIYQKYLDGQLTKEDFINYREQFALDKMGESRGDFAAYLGNLLQIDFMRKELEAQGIKLEE